MPQRNRFSNQRKVRRAAANAPPPRAPIVYEKKIPVNYGKPFIVMEDEQKNVFVFKGGSWVPYALTIVECKQECQVKELPQKVNRMTRYEIRCPLPTDA